MAWSRLRMVAIVLTSLPGSHPYAGEAGSGLDRKVDGCVSKSLIGIGGLVIAMLVESRRMMSRM